MVLRSRFCLCICMFLAAASAAFPLTSNELRAKVGQATHGFKDVTLTCKVGYANHKELSKIGKDFPKTYEFKSTTVWYKAPDKMKIEGKLGMVRVAIIMNDDKKAIQIPSIHYSKTEDISSDPHKRQTDLDIGIVTESLWQDYSVVDVETEKNSDPVYKITFVRDNARSKKHVAWVDANTLKLLKVEKYEGNGKLKSRFLYSGHTSVNGVWVPTRIEVFSPDGKLAGTTTYEGIKVNTNLADSIFKL